MNNFLQNASDALNPTKDATQGEDGKTHTNPIPKQLESLTTTIFQSLFAPISPQNTSLNSIKRVMLLDRLPSKSKPLDSEAEDHQFVLQLRHFAIKSSTPKSANLPKALRRLDTAEKLTHSQSAKALPNLGKLDDVADYLLDPTAAAGFTSASESEADTDAEVEVLAPESRKVLGKEDRQRMRDAQRVRIAAQTAAAAGDNPDAEAGAARPERKTRTEKKAIKLQELGPRMTLRLTKVEEGLCGGKIMWHEYISKTAKETKLQEKTWEQRRQIREQRKAVQKANVEKKKAEKTSQRGKKREGAGEKDAEGDEEMAEDDDDDDEDMWSDDDDEWDGAHDGEGGDKIVPSSMQDKDDDDEEEEDDEDEDE